MVIITNFAASHCSPHKFSALEFMGRWDNSIIWYHADSQTAAEATHPPSRDCLSSTDWKYRPYIIFDLVHDIVIFRQAELSLDLAPNAD